MENGLVVKNLSKQYPGFCLGNMSFTIPQGCVVGLVGANGAGKTTTIKLILNLIQKDSGTIEIMGMDHAKEEKQVKEKIGVVLVDSFLSDYLTLKDVNKIMKEIYQNWDEDYYYQAVARFELPKDKMLKDYSTGMKMKLKIISALAHKPQMLLLDEPTSGLDPVVRNDILDLFREFVEDEKHTILFSSHITSDLEHIADYILFIDQGKIVMQEETEKLLDEYGIVRCEESEFQKFAKEDYLTYKKNKYDYEVLICNKPKFKAKYSSKVIDKPTIEQIMLLYIKGGKKDD